MSGITYIVNVEAAIYKGDQWLIIRRSDREEHAAGLLSLVGGKVETTAGEVSVLEEALRREIAEEVDIQVAKDICYIESNSFVTDRGDKVIDIVFLCKYKEGEPRCASIEEVSEVRWMTAEEIAGNGNAPVWLKESIKKAERKRLEITGQLR